MDLLYQEIRQISRKPDIKDQQNELLKEVLACFEDNIRCAASRHRFSAYILAYSDDSTNRYKTKIRDLVDLDTIRETIGRFQLKYVAISDTIHSLRVEWKKE